jgi:D-methionine transport system substrate-binding protein
LEAGLVPSEDALVLEDVEGNPFANGFVARAESVDDPRIRRVAEALASREVAEFANSNWPGAVLSAT